MEINVEEFYTRYGPMVLRRCRHLLRDEEKAMDAMQEVFTKVLLNQKRLKNQYPSSLLYRIATNTCLNIIRADRSSQFTADEDTLINIAMYDESEEKLVMENLLDSIFKREKQSTREIAVLHFVDGMTLKETAKEVGLSLSGVRKRIRELKARVNIEKEVYYET
ncbi:MAG: sigma-70 family RNA polymerase sigma factor [bacterium]|nr:sigma-70 family RNA polymerase sigma factor [bacterium]